MPNKLLPGRPNLEQYRKQAKDLLDAHAQADAAALLAFCRERLASYKTPARLVFKAPAEFPRTATGKIHKPGLKEELARE